MKQVFGFRGTWQRLKDGARLVCLIGFYLAFFVCLVCLVFICSFFVQRRNVTHFHWRKHIAID